MLPTTSGSFCERFKRLFSFPLAFYNLLVYLVDEAGLPSPDFQTDLCAMDCLSGGTGGGGTGPPNPSMPAPTGLTATDGAFSDHVQVSWNAVTPPAGVSAVTAYLVYRSLNTNTNPNLASLIATVSAPTVTYDDATAVQGTVYRYWVKAKNNTQTSAFSSPDDGSASAPDATLDPVIDLKASLGFGYAHIALVWTPPTGATKYDVWRNTTNDFSTAVKIYEDIEPADSNLLAHPTGDPTFWNNEDDLLLEHTPPSATVDYYFWVVAKKDSPPAFSDESNGAIGRVAAPAIYNLTTATLDYLTTNFEVPVGATKMRAVIFPSGGGGAGGNATYGGGGGGGGGLIFEAFTVVAGNDIDLVVTGPTPDTGNAATGADGDDGAILELQINTVPKMTSNGGHGGVFNPAGSGAGGAGDTATGTTSPTVYNGHAGMPGNGAIGGRSGYSFAGRRLPAANAAGPYNGNSFVGSGASAFPVNPTHSVGGSGLAGNVLLQFGT